MRTPRFPVCLSARLPGRLLAASVIAATLHGLALAPAAPASWFSPTAAFARGAASEDEPAVPKRSRTISLASAEALERTAAQQYSDLLRQAAAKGALAPAGNPQLIRLRGISRRLIAQSGRYNERAAQWKWEVNLIGSRQVNAFCMPGGKIAVFSGLIDQLKLNDDELAIIVGHEIAHALQEHGRERVGKQRLAQIGTVIASIGGALLGFGDLGGQVASGAAQLTLLKYGRDDETEADVIGLDLAARAGFDPRAGLIVWEKMSAVSQGQPPQWLSSHPSHATRISEIARELNRAMPLYSKATGTPLDQMSPYTSNYGQPIPWPLPATGRKR